MKICPHPPVQGGHKNGHNFNCLQHIHAEFGFGTGSVLSMNSYVTLSYTRDKGRLPWQSILGLNLLSMHFYQRQLEC